jgi:hypothetical protein
MSLIHTSFWLHYLLGILVLGGQTTSPVLAQSTWMCPALPASSGVVVNVSTVTELESAVNNAITGSTILIADGVYQLNGVYLRVDVPNLTIRSASGNREAVILDGNYLTTEIIQIVASNVTIANLTLQEAYDHPIHVMTNGSDATLNTLIYNVHIIDPGQQAIKINPVGNNYPDNGVIACSHVELTSAGRAHIRNNCYTGGVDAHQAMNWTIRDNLIEGFWCPNGLSEHAIHMWVTSRDSLVERNLLKNNARGIGFGLVTSGSGRTYPDDPCPGNYIDHYGGIIRNNFIFAGDNELFSSEYDFDTGIALWNVCQAKVQYNTIYTTQPAQTFSAVEWRFDHTTAEITYNLANDQMLARDGASASLVGNLTDAQAGWFVEANSGDLHLNANASEAIDQVITSVGVIDDFDGDPRPVGIASDIGADERRLFVYIPIFFK